MVTDVVRARFWSMVGPVTSTGCREWSGGRSAHGYGHMKVDGKWRQAHRLAWEVANGPIPAGLLVRHTCDNRPCVEISHLLLGTYQDNADDMVARGRGYRWNGRLSGAANHSAKLTSEQVAEIRANVEGLMNKDLAVRYGVSRSLVSMIKNRRLWARD